MSNLSELLPSGGGQNQVEFVASGTLPNGKPVILKSNGQVEVVGESSTSVAESIPAGSAAVFNSGSTIYNFVAFDPNTANKFVVAYYDGGNSGYGTAIVGTVSGTALSFGSEVVFNSGATRYISVSFDPNTANKFVIAYQDSDNNNYGGAIVGTISGTTLSFGSEVVFNSSDTYNPFVTFDPNTAGKFVVAYKDVGNSSYGTAIVGAVSGTTITYGSESVFNSGNSAEISAAFDPNTAGKFVVVYVDYSNSSYGTAAVGTVSGTTISFGSEYVYNSATSYYNYCAFDPNTAGKFVVAYRAESNSGYGESVVGTVSGTTISFGSTYVFNSGQTYYPSVSSDPNTANKFVIAYKDGSNANYGTVIVGTVSGTSISYGSEFVFESARSDHISVAFDPNTAGKFVVAYLDDANSSYGTAIVGQIATTITTTNLTSTNLIGIAAEAASSGATAKINTWGGINEAQSSLTIASDYYVQTDGTITTATGGQKVGQAISATTINMRNQP
jgi:hypothetical protein